MLAGRIINVLLTLENFISRFYRGYRRRVILRSLRIGSGCNITHDLNVKYPENVVIGANVNISPGVTIGAFREVIIEDGVTLSQDVIIETAGLAKGSRSHVGRPIKIGKNVWIGSRSIVLSGVNIGENSVIGAGSIIRNNVAKNSVCKGN